MAPVTGQQLAALAPYIAGARPDDRGEIEAYCPVHPDMKRSASINVERGVWYCHAGCGGGSVRALVLAEDSWVPPDGRVQEEKVPSVATPGEARLPTMKNVLHWHHRLRREENVSRFLFEKRGIGAGAVRKAMLGWDGKTFKIPVFGPGRELWNVRNYDPNPRPGRSKIWNTRGMGEARLYPVGVVDRRASLNDAVLFCEGEWDALLALQHGYLAVTRTCGAGKPWNDDWTAYFAGLRVFMAQDKDKAGDEDKVIIADALDDVADLYACDLPFEWRERNGRDLTDYMLQQLPEDRDLALGNLLNRAKRWDS